MAPAIDPRLPPAVRGDRRGILGQRQCPSWNFEESLWLSGHLAPGLYDPQVLPADYPALGHFRTVVETRVPNNVLPASGLAVE